jgi:NhaP-type Na+/H+ or K+/H+ antiporter
VGIRPDDEQIVQKVLVRMNEQAWGIAFGLVLGLGLLLATIILIAKGGEPVGPHLGLLSVYFPGYSVSYLGGVIGFIYLFVIGYAIGRTIVVVYNRLVEAIER